MHPLKHPTLRNALIALVTLAVLALLGLAGWQYLAARDAGSKRANDLAATAAPAMPVIELLAEDIVLAERRALERTLPVNGSLRALQQAIVRSRASGELLDLLVREGESVRAGQVLARIDPTEAQLRLRQAEDNIAAATGQLEIARKSRDNSKSLADRGFISATAYQNAESQFATAQATVNVSQAARDLARKALADTEVRAPISGVVAARLVQPGEKVSMDMRLLDLVDLRRLELEASVPASDIGQVRVGQEMSIRVEGHDTPLAGKVVRISPANQPGSRAYLIYAQMTNPTATLRAGLFAQGTLTLEKRADVVTLPQSALRKRGERSVVYLIEDGKLMEHEIQVGLLSDASGGIAEIVSGLNAATQVVRVNLGSLRSGSPVRIAGPRAPGT